MQRLLLLSLLLLGIAVCYVKSTPGTQSKFQKGAMRNVEAERAMERANAHTLVLPLQAFNKTMLR
jgi:hypothetical protein